MSLDVIDRPTLPSRVAILPAAPVGLVADAPRSRRRRSRPLPWWLVLTLVGFLAGVAVGLAIGVGLAD